MYVCGTNDKNQLYTNNYSINNPNITTPVRNQIDPKTIISFSTYYDHSVWVTKDGNAYGIGDNRKGQFDPLSKKKIYYVPTKIKFLQQMFQSEKFVSAACGGSYTLYSTVLEDDNDQQPIVHFVDENFIQNQNSFNFDNTIYMYSGNYNAAIITDSGELYIYNDLNTYKPVKPFDIKVQDIALCKYFAIAVTENLEAISIPIGVKSKMIKFKSLNKYNIQTISGTYEQAVAVASEKEDADKYYIILFYFNTEHQRPKSTAISLEKFYSNEIYFKLVSCAENYTLLLTYDGDVYITQNFEDYQKITFQSPRRTTFIIAGRNTQTFLTFDPSIQMPNYHISEEPPNIRDENEEEEEEEEYDGFMSRNDALLREKLEEQKQITSNEIDQLAQEIFSLQSPKSAEIAYKKIDTIGYPTFYSETIKVQYTENEEKKFYALKTLKNICINDYCNLISKIEKLNNDFYHPLIVRAVAYNYNINNMENAKKQRLAQIRLKEERKAENPRQIEIDPDLDEELDSKNESYHNLDITIEKSILRTQNDFYHPFILMPYFPQNLFDAVTSDSFSNTEKLYIITEILITVSYLHDNGIYHQRLTPWNILISNSKDAFISDIFSSEFIENDQMVILKEKKALWFIDPEIINSDTLDYEQNDDIIKKNHDIYSIGKLIFFILAGSIGESEKEATFSNRALLQYLANSENQDDPNINLVESLEFPSDFSEYAKKLISDCISFTKEGRPSVKTILEGIKSDNYQLIPKVNEKIINERLLVIEEKLHK